MHYWRKRSWIAFKSQETAMAEDDDPFRKLQDEIDDVRSVQPNLIEENFHVITFVDVDAEAKAVQPPTSAEL